jgi:hypothetical protein
VYASLSTTGVVADKNENGKHDSEPEQMLGLQPEQDEDVRKRMRVDEEEERESKRKGKEKKEELVFPSNRWIKQAYENNDISVEFQGVSTDEMVQGTAGETAPLTIFECARKF